MLGLKSNFCEAMINPISSIPADSEQLQNDLPSQEQSFHTSQELFYDASHGSLVLEEIKNLFQDQSFHATQEQFNDTSQEQFNNTFQEQFSDTSQEQFSDTSQEQFNNTSQEQFNNTFQEQFNDTSKVLSQFNDISQDEFNDISQDEFNDISQEQFIDTSLEQCNITSLEQCNTTSVDQCNATLEKCNDASQGLLALDEIQNTQSPHCKSPLNQEPIEPIYVDIGSDDSMHSWRPNLNSTSQDCSFFFPYRLTNDNTTSENINVLKTIEEVDSQSSSTAYWEEISQANSHTEPAILSILNLNDENKINTDLQNQLHCQKVQLNILKYELAKAKLELHKWKEKISDTEKKISETFSPIQEIMLLNEENAILRNECHGLCLEVDYYVKEKAPLGEVNEEFYKANGLIERKDNTKGRMQTEVQQAPTQESDESNTWDCSVCTFINHTDIKSCEICDTQRETRNARHCLSLNAACYCHPNEESVPISG